MLVRLDALPGTAAFSRHIRVRCIDHSRHVQIMEFVSFDRNIVQYYGVCMEGENAAMLVLEYMAVRLCARIQVRGCCSSGVMTLPTVACTSAEVEAHNDSLCGTPQ